MGGPGSGGPGPGSRGNAGADSQRAERSWEGVPGPRRKDVGRAGWEHEEEREHPQQSTCRPASPTFISCS